MKQERVNIRISNTLKKSLESLASDEGLTVSAYLTRLITLKVRENEKDT